MNVFMELIHSVYDYKYYPNYLKNKKGKIFGAGVLLVTFYFLIASVCPMLLGQLRSGGFVKQIQENVPDFRLEDGILEVDETIELDDGDILVYIDTDPYYVFYDADEMKSELSEYRQAILMDSEKIIMKNNGEIQQMYFSDLGFDIERDDLLKFVPYIYLFLLLVLVFVYIWDVAIFFFGVLFVALIGMGIASGMKKDLTFGQIYILGVYSRTLSLIIKALVSLLPFSIPMFWLLNFGISVVILVVAMHYLPDKPVSQPWQNGQDMGQNQWNTGNSVYYDPKNGGGK